MVPVFYSSAYVLSGHSFDTTRKAKWIADSLAISPIPAIELIEPALLTREQVARVHALEYVAAVETGIPRALAESQGFTWDAGLWPMVLASNGGAVAAAKSALEHGVAGSLSSGLHHARHDRGAGGARSRGEVDPYARPRRPLRRRDAVTNSLRFPNLADRRVGVPF